MTEYLKDLQIRDIRTKQLLELKGAFQLGDYVVELLSKLKLEGVIRGAYFTHYFDPDTPPHVKVGIRYNEASDLASASSQLDILCDKHKDIVSDKGNFKATIGQIPELPDDIVVDYVVCHSFEFLLEIRKEFGNELPKVENIVSFLLQHSENITDHVIRAKDIFRNEQDARILSEAETRVVWERFVHHLLNASKSTYDASKPEQSYEAKVKIALFRNGIPIS
jgi:hypothetical protein